MTEANVRDDIQRELLSIKDIDDNFVFFQPDPTRHALPSGSVTINDWNGPLHAPNENAPYAIIGISDVAESKGLQTNDGSDLWNIPIDIIVKFVDYPETRGKLGTVRQYVIDHLTRPTSYDNLSGRLSFGIRTLKAKGPIYDILERYDIPEEIRSRYPIFLGQTIMILVEEKSLG